MGRPPAAAVRHDKLFIRDPVHAHGAAGQQHHAVAVVALPHEHAARQVHLRTRLLRELPQHGRVQVRQQRHPHQLGCQL